MREKKCFRQFMRGYTISIAGNSIKRTGSLFFIFFFLFPVLEKKSLYISNGKI
jgi:Zn-dependent protease